MKRFLFIAYFLVVPMCAFAQDNNEVYSMCQDKLIEEPDDAFCNGYTLGYIAALGEVGTFGIDIGTFGRGAEAPAIFFWQDGALEEQNGAIISVLAPTNPRAGSPEGLPAGEAFLYRQYSVEEFTASGFAEIYGIGQSPEEIAETLSQTDVDSRYPRALGRAAEFFNFEGPSNLAIVPPVDVDQSVRSLEQRGNRF
ncbi:hypothetical protein [Pararhodobacter sp. SW119]|uniref:hypothetical protein n=1 Tax=Pararhodobacter sp. SW119 TaxID=2780075 RepID=UPI001AE080BB|nr:hypothetical protein [Pararhodobacter sp. SW119]